jgi:multidrug resistance efflux pump
MKNEPRAQRWPWIIGLVLLVGTALGAGFFLNHTPAGGDATYSDKDKGGGPPLTVCIGQVDTDPGVTKLYPLVPGRVLEVVAEGIEVNKGDVVLRLDSKMAEYKLREAKADLDAAKELLAQAEKLPELHKRKLEQQRAAMAAIKHQREAAFREFKVKEELFDEKALGLNVKLAYEETVKKVDEMVKVEEAKLEELKLLDSQPQADINRARADVAVKETRLDQAAFALKECNLTAPSDGTVLRVLAQPGEILGTNPTAPAVQFCPKGPKIIRAEVLQEWAYRVEKGQEVTIEDDTYAGATWKGRVKHVSGWFAEKRHKIFEPFMVNDVRTLECIVEVTSEGRMLRIGQRVRVKIKQSES